MLIQPLPLSVLHVALCFRRFEQAGFLGIPWIVAREKRMAIQTLGARPLSLLCDKLRLAAT